MKCINAQLNLDSLRPGKAALKKKVTLILHFWVKEMNTCGDRLSSGPGPVSEYKVEMSGVSFRRKAVK